MAGGGILPFACLLASMVFLGRPPGNWLGWAVVGSALLFAGLSIILVLRAAPGLFARLAPAARRQAARLDSLPANRLKAYIFFAALLSIYLELVLIRWQASLFPFFSLYKNYSLLSCFAGLGLGYALATRPSIPLFMTLPLMLWQAVVFTATHFLVSSTGFTLTRVDPIMERFSMGMFSGSDPFLVTSLYLFLAVTFLMNVLIALPIGQLCGRLMERLPKLTAYGVNLAGSICGMALLSVLSLFNSPPAVWFAAGLCILLIGPLPPGRPLWLQTGFLLLLVAVLALPLPHSLQTIYSPYQTIQLRRAAMGPYEIVAGGHYHQRMLNLSPAALNEAGRQELTQSAAYYNLPYQLAQNLDRVLVVGAGAGNDVAAALRNGARQVDAVEIDPVILQLGQRHHPEKPYASPRVNSIINDARSFLKQTDRQYSAIVYGLLDSHALLSHAANVRLDSFVYTLEGLKEARERLAPGGLLSLNFCVLNPRMGRKIYLTLKEAFDGTPPLCLGTTYDQAVVFLSRNGAPLQPAPGLLDRLGMVDVSEVYRDQGLKADVSLDDWPFFYMPSRVYPISYLPMAALVLAMAILMARRFPGLKPSAAHGVFFFMGAGFMLLETKAITQLGLAFGNTWQVVSLAIGWILLMGFLANLLVARFQPKRASIPLCLLLLSLVAGWCLFRFVQFPGGVGGGLLQAMVLTGPAFFASWLFSILLRDRLDYSQAMGANLLGAMLGGLLEYNAMFFGLNHLFMLALILYGLAGLFVLRGAQTATD